MDLIRQRQFDLSVGKWRAGGEDDDGGDDDEGWGMEWWRDVFVFSGGKVDFVCAHANGQAAQGCWSEAKLVQDRSELAKQTGKHTEVQFVYVFQLSVGDVRLTRVSYTSWL